LNILRRKPGDTFDASARALYGQDGQFAAEGAVGGPVTDQFAVRAAGTYSGTDGWIKNVNIGGDAPWERNWAGRLSFAFKPSESFQSLLKLESSKSELRGTGFNQPFQIVNCPPPPPIVPQFAGPGCAEALAAGDPIGLDNNRNAGNRGMGSDYQANEGVLTMSYQHGGRTLTSVTGYYDYDFGLRHDNDGTSLLLMTRDLPETYHQFSQEFRIASPTDQTVEWLAGAYYQTDRLHTALTSNFFFVTPFFPPTDPLTPYLPLGLDYDFHQKEDVYSVFGSATWKVTDRLRLSAGLRGSQVKKDYDLNVFYGTATQDYGGLVPLPASVQSPTGYFGQGVPGFLSGDRSDHAWMPSARLQYNLTPAAMVYASYARGFKAGGFNGTESTGIAANVPFNPEYVNAYEVGLKSEWLNHRVLANLAVFRSNYTDLQVAFWDFQKGGGGAVPHIRNAAESRSQGVELETQWVANPMLRFSADVTFLDARYLKYPNAAGTVLDQFLGAVNGTSGLQDLSGARTQFSPDWSGNVTATLRVPMGGRYRFTTELSPYFSTGYHVIFLIDKQFFWQDPYVRLDGRLGFESVDDHWSVDLIGKNLTDRTIITAFGSPYQASKQQPRNVALQFRYRW
jgi:outer membrane receptor protein involved in Fe transport